MMLRTRPDLWVNSAQVTQLQVKVSDTADEAWTIDLTLACGTVVTAVRGNGQGLAEAAVAKVLDWLAGQ